MDTWILHANVVKVGKNDDYYYYKLDKALDKLKTIFWAQNEKIKNIAVGDIVYMYANKPIGKICWKCRVLAVKCTYEDTKEIDDKEFEPVETERSEYYIKITALGESLGKYEEKERSALSFYKLCENGLTQKRSDHQLNSPRVNPQLLQYINSIKPLELYND